MLLMRIAEIAFCSVNISAMKSFYVQNLGFPLVKDSDQAFVIRAGETLVRFYQSEEQEVVPFYHFAFAIPENKYAEARKLMEQKVPLVQFAEEDGTQSSEVHFVSWNAHSFYFVDPDQNIVEMIARHDLQNQRTETFSIEQVMRVDEVGLPVKDVSAGIAYMKKELGLMPWKEPTEKFAPIGDQKGLFILVEEGRIWFGTDRASKRLPVSISMLGEEDKIYHFEDGLYTIQIVNQHA
jgi:catechol-2,3-dioxygenase